MLGFSETPYDLRFTFLGIPVRVHPLFWLVAALLGWRQNNLPAVLIWVACVFISVVVHEYGHGLVAKAFGSTPSILLWGPMGLCYYPRSSRMTPRQHLAITLSGPGAGFLLCGVVMFLFSLLFGLTPLGHLSMVREVLGLPADPGPLLDTMGKLRSETYLRLYAYLIQINLFWSLVNLLPVWPLDGGRVSEILLSSINPFEGTRWAHILSLLVAGGLAVLIYSATRELFPTLFFAYFAFMNFQVLQSIHQAQTLGLSNNEDWWRR